MKKRTCLMLLAGMILSCGLLLTGCGGEEPDEASTRVIGLTITPAPSPTPTSVPLEDMNNASASSDGVTMTNQYILENGK